MITSLTCAVMIASCGTAVEEPATGRQAAAVESAAEAGDPSAPPAPQEGLSSIPQADEGDPSPSAQEAGEASVDVPVEGRFGGDILDLNVLPFGIVNNLTVPVEVAVSDVDPYDWLVDGPYGRPDSGSPRGFAGVRLQPSAHTFAAFWPRAIASGAPFTLDLSYIDQAMGRVPRRAPMASVAFNKVYFCTYSMMVQSPCNMFTRKSWYGWSFRSDDDASISQQVPAVCGRTSAEFTYLVRGTAHRGHGRLECASKDAGGIGNALVLEDVSS